MGFKCGIVGLPNVGKSTLFNALTETAAAAAANYPFCTIEPNVGEVPVPDPRLDALAKVAKSAEVIPTRLTFVDIAGLVRGASKGEGLGNQFLAVIREVDAIAYVLRCFEDDDIIHVEGKVDPIADAETIETELMLADLDSLERRISTLERKVRIKTGGGNAGHNGLRSVSEHMGNDYKRARLGIGHPGAKELVHSYVLSDFAKAERLWVETLCDAIADNAGILARGEDSSFQNKIHLTMVAKGFDTNGSNSNDR